MPGEGGATQPGGGGRGGGCHPGGGCAPGDGAYGSSVPDIVVPPDPSRRPRGDGAGVLSRAAPSVLPGHPVRSASRILRNCRSLPR